MDNDKEAQRIKEKFDKLNIDLLDEQLFEKRMSEIIQGNEIPVRRSISLHHCHSLPNSLIMDKKKRNVRKRFSTRIKPSERKRRRNFWELDNLDKLTLIKELSRKKSHVLWIAKLENYSLIAKQFHSPTSQLKREIRNKIRLIRSLEHPHISSYYGVGCNKQEYYVFKELVNGGSIADFLKSGPMNEISAAHVIYQLLLALKFLHENQIIHGNICPSKILLSTAGIVKLSGFDPKPNRLNIIPHYSAPEVVSNDCFTVSSDIWSVACILFELVTGDIPFHTLSPFDVVQQLSSASVIPDIPSTLSPSCSAFLNLCWKLNPNDRASIDSLLSHKFLKLSPAGHSSLLGFIRRKLYKKETSQGYLTSKQLISRE